VTIVTRETRETSVRIELLPKSVGDALPTVDATTTVPFLDHMMVTLCRYAGIAARIDARGDLRHHIIEDVAIALGGAISDATAATAARYGNRTIPMDDALVQCVVDLGGRAYYAGRLPSKIYEHWMRSFAMSAQATIHIRVIRGRDRHHIVEAAFKALGLALRDAMIDSGAVFSTKGNVSLVSG
jgi:imidazoleglycerol-phosphate dehydratase